MIYSSKIENNFSIQTKGVMLILSSPSGTGKTTISRKILELEENLELSVSATTRAQRQNEVNKVDYHFLSEEEFLTYKLNEKFLESAKVFDYYYGTPKKPVIDSLKQGKNVLFDIDWQGARQILQLYKEDTITIFLLPPSMKELKKRLELRALDSESTVKKRIKEAYNEIKHFYEYDYVLINDDLEKTLNKVRQILQAELLKRNRQQGLDKFINHLTHS